ncbi:MAG: sugar phosphate isomerase/epimerase [Planctomycetota bacterium]
MPTPSRRDVLRSLPLIALSPAPLAAANRADQALGHVLKLGLTTYSTRALSLADTVKAAVRLGLERVSVKDVHLALDSSAAERRAVASQLRDAGLQVLGCGVIAMPNDAAEIRRRFEYARDLGAPTIIASPDPLALDTLEAMVREFDIRVAIHNHGPEDAWYPTPAAAAARVAARDRRIGLCVDVGHAARAGVDPAAAIRTHADRLLDLHLKDLDRAAADAHAVELGRGALDIPAIMRALRDVRFAGNIALEHEKDEQDPVPGMAESVGFARGILRML